MRHFVRLLAAVAALAAAGAAGAQQTVTLKMQATWPASLTLYENFTYFAERVGKISNGTLKIDAMPAGQVVPAFEVLDATQQEGARRRPRLVGYWVGKNKAAILFTGGPGGTFGMDMIDALGWMYHGGGNELCNEFFQKELEPQRASGIPILPSGPQAFGWFKRPIKNLADFKGMKCRQTGMAAEVWQRMGMTTVNMPGGEIIPSAQRGVIDCAEWVGGVEDLRLGFHNVWKYHYTPGMHENVTIGELVFNIDVWKGLSPAAQEDDQERGERVLPHLVGEVAEAERRGASRSCSKKHGVRILRTPPDILVEFLKTWDIIAAEEGAEEPVLQEGARFAARSTPRSWCRRSASTSRRTRSRPTTTGRRAVASRRGGKADAKKK